MATKGSVLITGCTDNGIGSTLAIVFQRQGWQVFATARDVQKMSKLNGLANVTLLQQDICNSSHTKAVVERVKKEAGGKLTYLINNAGKMHYMPMLDDGPEAVKEIFEINVFAQLALTQALMPLLIEAKGTVVFISSVAGHICVPYQGTYSASKAALEMMAGHLRVELAPFHVKVLSVVTSTVYANTFTRFDDAKLPEDSRYKSVESIYVDRAQGRDGAPRMDTMVYAEKVFVEITKGRTGSFWYGGLATLVKFVAEWVPTAWADSMAVRGTGIDVLLKAK
ncbi:hypothetical protein BDV96DRAFT_122594 [Lophiotrema nucula]|uniref:Hydroxybutyrate dehydrogenase n=1 Tax=Lophiotrema nucula TaxID=690887 RepID=A0A6A5Z1S0_9PLEO|nr:hypothetical protein BDV96DRAFT_122594 [Lophiotrema nucula]